MFSKLPFTKGIWIKGKLPKGKRSNMSSLKKTKAQRLKVFGLQLNPALLIKEN
jgi:hypothetical protein